MEFSLISDVSLFFLTSSTSLSIRILVCLGLHSLYPFSGLSLVGCKVHFDFCSSFINMFVCLQRTVRECLGRISAPSFWFNILSIISYHLLLSVLWKPVRISGLVTALPDYARLLCPVSFASDSLQNRIT